MSLSKALTAAAGNAGGESLYAEDVFSTYLYEGNNAARTIANGIALSDEDGLVWLKQRGATDSHVLFDTVNGPQKSLTSNDTAAGADYSSYLSFPSAGTTGWNLAGAILNGTGTSWASWTFRKAEKFFDVVAYDGNSVEGRVLNHSLNSTPKFIIIKATDGSSNWTCHHTSLGFSKVLYLNSNSAQDNGSRIQAATDTTFTVSSSSLTNSSARSYVAYLFAHNAGGFGDDGSENIIKCGSYTGNASERSVSLGFEPQWVLVKNADNTDDWWIADNMRGVVTGGNDAFIKPNKNESEDSGADYIDFNANGFTVKTGYGIVNESGSKYIYVAIRRPMKTPESGTEVFSPYAYQDATLTSGSGTASNRTIINGGSNGGSGFPVDQFWHQKTSSNSSYGFHIFDRIRGKGQALITPSYSASPAGDSASNGGFDFQEGVDVEYNGAMYYYNSNAGNRSHISYAFKRASKVFDIVTYTGNATAGHAVTHNLQAIPEMMFVKAYNTSNEAHWVYHKTTGNAASLLVSGDGSGYGGLWNNTTPNDTTFTLSSSAAVNSSSYKYVAWLWATLDGVTKVGSYSGTGSNVDVDCGFSAGARFVLIKRSDGDGDWYVWDSARGIVAGNDPYVIFEGGSVTNTDYIDPLSSGFTVTSSAPAALNASGGTYIFLAIA